MKKGQYQGVAEQRWQLVGLQGYDRERKIVETLLNEGKISVPTSEDGRYSNVASFNVKALLFSDPQAKKQKQAALQAELAAASSPAAEKFVSGPVGGVVGINPP